ncbi:MAG: RNA polymerase sigma factor [Sphingobacteriia bacterium]|nr:RNA polymerase sigma factor [Sphingobacteriia bacterium]
MKTSQNDFKNIVKDHSPRLYAHIRSILLNHHDTDDVLQNTFIKAWIGLGDFKGNSELSTWLFRIATNEALQHLRKQRLRRMLFLPIETEIHNSINPDESLNDGRSIRLKLEKALQKLSVRQRMIFGMKYFNEMKYKDMAELLNLKEGTLKAVYHQATNKIEKYFEEND